MSFLTGVSYPQTRATTHKINGKNIRKKYINSNKWWHLEDEYVLLSFDAQNEILNEDPSIPGALRERKQFSCIAVAISAAKPPVR